MEGKGSPLHQAVQRRIYELLPEGEALIEYRMPGHIADLVWLPKKIVFEIQCSPISIDTAVSRTNDYRRMGFFIVWILHQKNFNATYLSLAELYLRKQKNCYYTNISHSGSGYIYDQHERLRNNKRIWRSEELEIDLKSPRIQRKKLLFKGDRLTKSLVTWYSLLQLLGIKQF